MLKPRRSPSAISKVEPRGPCPDSPASPWPDTGIQRHRLPFAIGTPQRGWLFGSSGSGRSAEGGRRGTEGGGQRAEGRTEGQHPTSSGGTQDHGPQTTDWGRRAKRRWQMPEGEHSTFNIQHSTFNIQHRMSEVLQLGHLLSVGR